MCRKLETEEEKVLPFGTVPPTPRTAEEDAQLVKESKTKLNDVISDYEVIFLIIMVLKKNPSNSMDFGDVTTRRS